MVTTSVTYRCVLSKNNLCLQSEQDQQRPSAAAGSLAPSITVDQTASLLGCNQSMVRVLLTAGQLTGHRVGKGLNPRGIRVHLSSIHDYISRNAVCPIADNDNAAVERSASRRNARRTAEHDDAIARLRAWGI